MQRKDSVTTSGSSACSGSLTCLAVRRSAQRACTLASIGIPGFSGKRGAAALALEGVCLTAQQKLQRSCNLASIGTPWTWLARAGLPRTAPWASWSTLSGATYT